jgi:hypothetical protein
MVRIGELRLRDEIDFLRYNTAFMERYHTTQAPRFYFPFSHNGVEFLSSISDVSNQES